MKTLDQSGIFVRTALLVMLLIGGLIGLTSLIAPFTGLPIDQGHRLQHIQLQVWYFIGGFVLGAGFRIIPQLTAQPLPDERIATVASMLYAISAAGWVFGFPFLFPDPGTGKWLFLGWQIMELLVWGSFVVCLLYCLYYSRQNGLWIGVVSAALVCIGLCSCLSFWGWLAGMNVLSIGLPGAAGGVKWVRQGYMGLLFVGVPLLAMGISGKVLRKKRDPDWAYLCGVVLLLISLLSFSQVVSGDRIQEVGTVLFIPGALLLGWGIQFHKQGNRLNIPGFSHGVVVAFSFVFLFAVLHVLQVHFEVMIMYRGLIHLWAIGFLTTLIIAFGTWIFPSAAGRVPINSPSILIAIYTIAAGTMLRVLVPPGLQYGYLSSSMMDAGLFGAGLLQYTGVWIFAVALWPHLPSLKGGEAHD